MVRIIRQQERGRRHRIEELHHLCAGRNTESLEVVSNIVDYRQQRRVYGCELSIACGDEIVDGLIDIRDRRPLSNNLWTHLYEEVSIAAPEGLYADHRRQGFLCFKRLVEVDAEVLLHTQRLEKERTHSHNPLL